MERQDTRGILDPAGLHRWVSFARYPVPEGLRGLVGSLWSVDWALPDGRIHRQDVLPHPAVNVSLGCAPAHGLSAQPGPYPFRAQVYGVWRRRMSRMLAEDGWTVGARTTPGGFGAFTALSVASLTDRITVAGHILPGVPEVRELAELGLPRRAELLGDWLLRVLDAAEPARVAAAQEVAGIAARAENEPAIATAAELADSAGVSLRTLQRMFTSYAGVSPTWVIRRYRLLDAANAVSGGGRPDWAQLAARLGYADQPHLIREFRATVGTTPQAYADAVAAGDKTGRVELRP